MHTTRFRRAVALGALPALLLLAAASGCDKRGGAADDKTLRESLTNPKPFDPNTLTPTQRAGYEASMKAAGAPAPSAPGALSAPGAPSAPKSAGP